jgi:outer membrane receptor protein involved in Fe transport
MVDPGAFVEFVLPWRSYWKTTLGARADWLHTDARESEIRADSSLPGFDEDMARNNTMYAFFLSNDIDLDEYWSVDAGFGHAHRPPTLTERYADGVFLGLFQNGFTRVIGNPFLNPERAWQADLGLKADYGDVRGGVRGFYTWILDYATYEVAQVGPGGPFGAQLARGIPTDLATLVGFEIDGAMDWSEYVTLFGSLSYIEGRDEDLGVPLTGIYPLEGRVGVRLHDASEENRWGFEFFGRIVDDQDRLGGLRSGPTIVTVEEATPGFTVWHMRGYWSATRNVRLMAGVENVFDRNYLEHLDLRLPASPIDGIPELRLLAPGITPYAGMEWKF